MWSFIQDQVLGMKWLNEAIISLLGNRNPLGVFIAICVVGIILVGYAFNAFQYLLI